MYLYSLISTGFFTLTTNLHCGLVDAKKDSPANGTLLNFVKSHKDNLMPYPCSHFFVDINFGDRLHAKVKSPGSPLLF